VRSIRGSTDHQEYAPEAISVPRPGGDYIIPPDL
jgi:hypothetical protein